MQPLKSLLNSILILCSANVPAQVQQVAQPASVIFENVRIFNGTSDQLSAPSNVLIMRNVVTAISTTPIAAPPETSVTRIQGNGRTLMPGLIDNHVHIFMSANSQAEMLNPKASFESLEKKAIEEAKLMLLRGFTAARDVGGRIWRKTID